MNIDGGCHCGQITYEAEIDPDKVAICNCTDCQTLSGTAFRTVAPSLAGGFTLLSGEPTVYTKVGDSGNRREQAFCPTCGAAIYATAPGPEPRVYNIRLGTARQRAELVPKVQIWSRSRLAWLDDAAKIRTIETQ